MGGRVAYYREVLREVEDLPAYLAEHSGLPGPRGNLELAQAVAEEAAPAALLDLAGSDDEYEAFCGVVALGRLVAEGRRDLVPVLRGHAGDARWRRTADPDVAWVVRENLRKARLRAVLGG